MSSNEAETPLFTEERRRSPDRRADSRPVQVQIVDALVRLRTILAEKCARLGLSMSWNDGASPVCQLQTNGATAKLFIFEAGYHGLIAPRVFYRLDPHVFEKGHVAAVKWAIQAELDSADQIVARRDLRDAEVVMSFEPIFEADFKGSTRVRVREQQGTPEMTAGVRYRLRIAFLEAQLRDTRDSLDRYNDRLDARADKWEACSRRIFKFEGRIVTWGDLAAVNDPGTMEEIATLAIGETKTLGQCDEIERVS